MYFMWHFALCYNYYGMVVVHIFPRKQFSQNTSLYKTALCSAWVCWWLMVSRRRVLESSGGGRAVQIHKIFTSFGELYCVYLCVLYSLVCVMALQTHWAQKLIGSNTIASKHKRNLWTLYFRWTTYFRYFFIIFLYNLLVINPNI